MVSTLEKPSPNCLAAIRDLSLPGPAHHSAHLSMQARAPGSPQHTCQPFPETPFPTVTCQNHLSFKAQHKGHLLQGASPIVPSPASCSCVAQTPVVPFTQPFGPCLSPFLDQEFTASCSTKAT